MTREYKTVRLSYEAKVWLNDLIKKRNGEMQKDIKEGLIDVLEKKLIDDESLFNLLNGLSVNVVLKVTIGSVIEQAVRFTRDYSEEEWNKTIIMMESAIKRIKDDDVSDITPRLYLNKEIIEELENLRLRLTSGGSRLLRLSYIIKLVVYAFHENYK